VLTPWQQYELPQIKLAVLSRLKSDLTCRPVLGACLQFMAQHMSADEVKGLKEMFESMDTDKSGAY
jgi:calcium-dependent protein kinase